MEKIKEKFINFCKYTINIISIIIISILLIMSIFKTSYINIIERTTYSNDNCILNILYILGALIILVTLQYLYKKCKTNIKKTSKFFLIGITIILSTILIYLIVNVGYHPTADQDKVIEVAKKIREANYEEVLIGGYLRLYPNQLGIVTLFYVLSYIFGPGNYVPIQLLNIVALILSFIVISKMFNLMFGRYKSDKRDKIVYIAFIAFVPLALYTTFVYGNILGFFLSIFAIYLEFLYIKNNNIKNMIFAIISMELSIIVKSNYLINMIAMLLILFINMIDKKNYKNILFIVATILIYLFSNFLLKANIELKSKVKLANGAPMVGWLAMGLQGNETNDFKANGWFNNYNVRIYTENDWNAKIAKKEAISNIKNNVKKYIKNPKIGIKFFIEKTESQWNEPTFQSLWIMSYMKKMDGEKNTISDKIDEEKLFNKYTNYANIIHTLILFGAISYFILNFKQNNIYELSFAIIFIGGFIFHLFWEAKSQYTITYFVLLIPYCVNGFIDLSKKVINKIEKIRKIKYANF